MSTDTLALPAPEALGGIPLGTPDPAAAPAPEAKPARPTTRAGRRAAAEARKAAKAAAGGQAPKADSRPKPSKPKPTKSDVTTSVESMHTMLGALLGVAGMPATGAALAASGTDAGQVWADAVRRYPQLERLFGAGTDGLIIFRLLMVYAPLVSLAVTERSAPKAEGAPGMDLSGLLAVVGVTPGQGEAPEPAAGVGGLG